MTYKPEWKQQKKSYRNIKKDNLFHRVSYRQDGGKKNTKAWWSSSKGSDLGHNGSCREKVNFAFQIGWPMQWSLIRISTKCWRNRKQAECRSPSNVTSFWGHSSRGRRAAHPAPSAEKTSIQLDPTAPEKYHQTSLRSTEMTQGTCTMEAAHSQKQVLQVICNPCE